MLNEPIKEADVVKMLENMSDKEFAVLEQDLKKDKQKATEGMLNVLSVMTEMVRLRELNKIQQEMIEVLQTKNKAMEVLMSNSGDPDKTSLEITFDCMMMRVNSYKDDDDKWVTRQLLVFIFKKKNLSKYVIAVLDPSKDNIKNQTWFRMLETNEVTTEESLRDRYSFWADTLKFKK